ncbi:hypothetical protein BH20ACT15_BH20ACT15_06560 [soil metagenome]
MGAGEIEIVKGGFEAFNERGVEGILPLIDEEFEVTTPADLAAEPDTYRGHAGVRRYFDSFYEAMEEIRWDAHEFRELPDGRIAVPFTLRARGRSTGLDFGQEAMQLWTLRDGKAIRMELFATLEEALEAD